MLDSISSKLGERSDMSFMRRYKSGTGEERERERGENSHFDHRAHMVLK